MRLALEDVINETCPWSGKPVAATSLTRYRDAVVGFCNPGCRDKFDAAVDMFESCLAEAPPNLPDVQSPEV
ncbi:glutathione S-transferase [Maricaulis maris]|uniref:glutathione S-transferase n=1 Tax=Maricaulis maris TaxID=74318 RepID=UPI003B8EA96A